MYMYLTGSLSSGMSYQKLLIRKKKISRKNM